MKKAFKLIEYLVNDSQAVASAMAHCQCKTKLAEENDQMTATLLKLSQAAKHFEEREIDSDR